ncbi:MAG: MtaA/CmuA family methyltransferase [Syntrophomonas sp.]
MITPKDRLINALNGESVDRPPCICPGGMMNMITAEIMHQLGNQWPEAHQNPQAMAGLALGVHRLSGIENLGVPFCMTVEAEAMGAKVNLGNMVTEPRVIDYPLSQMQDWSSLPDFNPETGRMGMVSAAVNILAENRFGLPVIANLTGPISLATSLIEPMTFFKAMGKQAQDVHAFLSFITNNLLVYGKALLKAGAQVITIADPSATGEILGPRRFSEFALPYLNLLLEGLKDDSEASMVHICGQLHSIFPELNQLKTGAISIDSATSVAKLKTALFDKIIVGNVSTQLLQNGQPLQIKASALNCLNKGATVLSPACGISTLTPLSNLKAMVDAVHEFNYQNSGERGND